MQSHRRFFPCWAAVAAVFQIVLFSGLFYRAEAQATSNLPESIAKANALTDLSGVGPYELHARIVINPGTKHAQQGEVTIYRDQTRSRIELQLEDFHQVEVVGEGTRYVSRSRPYPLAGLDVLNSVEDAVQLRPEYLRDKFKKHSRTVGGVPASCFNFKFQFSKVSYCFDDSTGTALEVSNSSGWRGRFSGYTAVGEKSFPTKIELTQPGVPRDVQLSEIHVTGRKFDDTNFAAPQGARAFPVCNGRTATWASWDFDWGTSATENGEVYVYAIVEADGSVHDLTVFGGQYRWMEKEVSKITHRWRFLPALCGSTAITSEAVWPLRRMDWNPGESGPVSWGGEGHTPSQSDFRTYYPPDAANIYRW